MQRIQILIELAVRNAILIVSQITCKFHSELVILVPENWLWLLLAVVVCKVHSFGSILSQLDWCIYDIALK